MKKTLSILLAVLIVLASFPLGLVAFADTVDTTPTVLTENFEGASSILTKTDTGVKAEQFYKEKNGNKSFTIDGFDFTNAFPEGVLSGTTAQGTGFNGNAYVLGKGANYRPTELTFKAKFTPKKSNVHLFIYTFAHSSGAVNAGLPVFDLSGSSKETTNGASAALGWSASYKPIIPTDKESGFSYETTDWIRETTNINVGANSLINTSEGLLESDKQANQDLVESTKWFDVKVQYTWFDADKKVKVVASFTDGISSSKNTVTYTYTPETVSNFYNVGFATDNSALLIMLDDIKYYYEPVVDDGVVDLAENFIAENQQIVDLADGFDVATDYATLTSKQKKEIKNQMKAFRDAAEELEYSYKIHTSIKTALLNVDAMEIAMDEYDATNPYAAKYVKVDFNDGKSPFVMNNSASTNTQFYNETSTDKALVLSNSFTSKLPEGTIDGTSSPYTTYPGDNGRSGSYVINNPGYRPLQIAFKLKAVANSSNNHLLMLPLAYPPVSAKSPQKMDVAQDIFLTSKEAANAQNAAQISLSKAWSGACAFNTSATLEYFSNFDTSTVEENKFSFPNAFNATVLGEEITLKEAKEIVDGAAWFDVKVYYDWNDSKNQVTITYTLSNGDKTYTAKNYIQYTSKEDIKDYYNFGLFCAGNTQTLTLIDDLTIYSENLVNGTTDGPHADFMEKHKDVIAAADGFDVTTDYSPLGNDDKNTLKSKISAFNTDYAALDKEVKDFFIVNTAYENVTNMNTAIVDYDATAVMSAFSTKYAGVLALVEDDLTVDVEDVFAYSGIETELADAIADFDEIDKDLQESTDGILINAKLNKLNKILGWKASDTYTQNFEGDVDFAPYAEYEGRKEDAHGVATGHTVNGVLTGSADDNKTYKIATTNPRDDSNYSDTIYGEFITADKTLFDIKANDGKYLSSGSFDFYTSNFSAGTQLMVGYSFESLTNYRYAGIFAERCSGKTRVYTLANRDYMFNASLESGKVSFKLNQGFYGYTNYANTWVHADFAYDTDGYFHLVFTDAAGRVYSTKSAVAVAKENRLVSFGTPGSSNNFYVDNVVFNFAADSAVNQDLVDFVSAQYTHETTEIKPENAVPYDFARLNKVISQYEAVETSLAQNKWLSDKISAYKSRIANWDTTSDATVVDSFADIYDGEFTSSAAYNAYSRLNKSQRALFKTEFEAEYIAMMNAVTSAQNDGIISIAAAGDSITHGSGTSDEATKAYPMQLLDKLGSDYTMNKCGIPGISLLRSWNATDYSSLDGAYRAGGAGGSSGEGYASSLEALADIVIITLGTNDQILAGGANEVTAEKKAQIKQVYTDLVMSYLQQDYNPEIIISSIPYNAGGDITAKKRFQIKADTLTAIYKEIAEEYDLGFVDMNKYTTNKWKEEPELYFAADMLHPNDTGAGDMADYMAQYIKNSVLVANTDMGCVYDFSNTQNVMYGPKLLGATVDNLIEEGSSEINLYFNVTLPESINLNEVEEVGVVTTMFSNLGSSVADKTALKVNSDNEEITKTEAEYRAAISRYQAAVVIPAADFGNRVIARAYVILTDGEVYYSVNDNNDMFGNTPQENTTIGVKSGYAIRSIVSITSSIAQYVANLDKEAELTEIPGKALTDYVVIDGSNKITGWSPDYDAVDNGLEFVLFISGNAAAISEIVNSN